MNASEAVFVSSRIVYLILIPILREFASVLFAIAISKDCKARDNGSGALWGIFTLIFPVLAGIIYGVYSRILVKRQPKTEIDKKKARASVKLSVGAILVYILSIIVAIIAIVTGVASKAALAIEDNNSSLKYVEMNIENPVNVYID